MTRKTTRISVTWSDDLQEYAEKIVGKYAGEMGKAGIPTRVATRRSGEETINRSGAIAYALMRLAELADSER